MHLLVFGCQQLVPRSAVLCVCGSRRGQQFAQQIQLQSPELIEQLRNHIRSRSFSGSAEEHSWWSSSCTQVPPLPPTDSTLCWQQHVKPALCRFCTAALLSIKKILELDCCCSIIKGAHRWVNPSRELFSEYSFLLVHFCPPSFPLWLRFV